MEVHLTPTEWRIVAALLRRRGRLVRQSELLREVWGPAYERETHYLRVYLAQIRRKLEDDPAEPVTAFDHPFEKPSGEASARLLFCRRRVLVSAVVRTDVRRCFWERTRRPF